MVKDFVVYSLLVWWMDCRVLSGTPAAQFWVWAGCVVNDTQVTERIPAVRWVEQVLMGCFPEAWCSDSLTSFTASWLGTRNANFPGRYWSPVFFPKLLSKHHFKVQLCFGSYLWKEGTYPTPGHFLCTSNHNVKMQITVKYGADINSVLTLHPFCCKGLFVFSSFFAAFTFFPCLTCFYERELLPTSLPLGSLSFHKVFASCFSVTFLHVAGHLHPFPSMHSLSSPTCTTLFCAIFISYDII